MALSPTGKQHVIVHADQVAVVTELGATLRRYTVAGREVVQPFDQAHSPFGGQGQQLAPWPNRVRDGRWSIEGTTHQLPLSEPERGCAIHGMVRWLPFTTLAKTESMVSQRVLLAPQPGWPVPLELVITHSLSGQGLLVEVAATNLGEQTVPFGYGAHPYLLPPEGDSIDEVELCVPFGEHLAVDERLLPVALRPVEGGPLDLRSARRLGSLELDTAYAAPLDAENWQVVLQANHCRTTLWSDETMPWLQLYTPGSRDAIAVEPMTIGPDAFNPGPTHERLVMLPAGVITRCRWGLRHEG